MYDIRRDLEYLVGINRNDTSNWFMILSQLISIQLKSVGSIELKNIGKIVKVSDNEFKFLPSDLMEIWLNNDTFENEFINTLEVNLGKIIKSDRNLFKKR